MANLEKKVAGQIEKLERQLAEAKEKKRLMAEYQSRLDKIDKEVAKLEAERRSILKELGVGAGKKSAPKGRRKRISVEDVEAAVKGETTLQELSSKLGVTKLTVLKFVKKSRALKYDSSTKPARISRK